MNADKKERIRKAIQNKRGNAYKDEWFERMISAMDAAEKVLAVKEARAMLQSGLRAALDFVNKWEAAK